MVGTFGLTTTRGIAMEFLGRESFLLLLVLDRRLPQRPGRVHLLHVHHCFYDVLHDYRASGCSNVSECSHRLSPFQCHLLFCHCFVSLFYVTFLRFSILNSFDSNGVLQPYSQLGWWKWMYRVSPQTYVIEGLVGQGELTVHGKLIEC